jgi:hypothetical protein
LHTVAVWCYVRRDSLIIRNSSYFSTSEPWATVTATVWCRRRCRPMNLSDCPTRGLTHFLSSGNTNLKNQINPKLRKLREIPDVISFFFLLHIFRIVIPIFRYLFIPLACGSEFSFFKLDFFFFFFFHQVERDDGRWASPIKIRYTLEREKFSPHFVCLLIAERL